MTGPSEQNRAPGEPATKPPRPIVTANQVTTARLIPMPLIAWLIYQGETAWYAAMAVAFVVGSTDYIDGKLARKYGPTVLGSLLDPLADKIFLAFIYVPLADLGFLPMWAVALMFMREFMVTAMRSAYFQRGIRFETSFLAKMKTWVQMQGVGTLTLCAVLGPTGSIVLLSAVLAVASLAQLGLWLLRKRTHRNLWAGIVFGIWPLGLYLFALEMGDMRWFFHGAMWVLTALTWVSGLDYLIGGLPKLRAAGGFRRADAVRVIAGAILPLLTLYCLVEGQVHILPILVIFACELAVGGLDNLMSTEGRAAPALPWTARTLGTAICLVLALVWPAHAIALGAAAASITYIGVAAEFWRGRDLYLERL